MICNVIVFILCQPVILNTCVSKCLIFYWNFSYLISVIWSRGSSVHLRKFGWICNTGYATSWMDLVCLCRDIHYDSLSRKVKFLYENIFIIFIMVSYMQLLYLIKTKSCEIYKNSVTCYNTVITSANEWLSNEDCFRCFSDSVNEYFIAATLHFNFIRIEVSTNISINEWDSGMNYLR